MDQDEKTERPPRAGAVRSTAPAGTPYPVAPKSPPPAPSPSESQPRTVGGHTARLLLAEEDPLDFDSFPGPPLSEAGLSDVGLSGLGLSDAGPPPSATVGGTMRLATVTPDSAAVAKSELARHESAKRAVPPGAPDAPSKPPADATAKVSPAALTTAVSGPAGDGGSGTLALLFAPASVAVGLVFFAMGSMIALTMEGRLIRLSVAVPADAAPAEAPLSASASPSGATHPAAVSSGLPVGVGEAPVPSALPSASASPRASVSVARPPAPPPVPPATGHPQGGGKLKPIIF